MTSDLLYDGKVSQCKCNLQFIIWTTVNTTGTDFTPCHPQTKYDTLQSMTPWLKVWVIFTLVSDVTRFLKQGFKICLCSNLIWSLHLNYKKKTPVTLAIPYLFLVLCDYLTCCAWTVLSLVCCSSCGIQNFTAGLVASRRRDRWQVSESLWSLWHSVIELRTLDYGLRLKGGWGQLLILPDT